MGQTSLCKCSFPLSSNGSRSIPVTAPAAVAEWKVKTFCLAGRGFGLAPTTSLRTVQPVFVDVTLPYSVIQGETFTLKATVFNYLQQCIQVCACATANTVWDRPIMPSSFTANVPHHLSPVAQSFSFVGTLLDTGIPG